MSVYDEKRRQREAQEREITAIFGPAIPDVWAALRKAGYLVNDRLDFGRFGQVRQPFSDHYRDEPLYVATLRVALRDAGAVNGVFPTILIATTPEDTVAHVAAEFERLDLLKRRAARAA